MHLNAEKNALNPPQPGLNPSSFFKEKLNSTDNASVPDNQDINSETSSLFELLEEDTSDSNSCNSPPRALFKIPRVYEPTLQTLYPE